MDREKPPVDGVTDGKYKSQEELVNKIESKHLTISSAVEDKSSESLTFKNKTQVADVRTTSNEGSEAHVRSFGPKTPEVIERPENTAPLSSVVPVVRGGTIAAIPKSSAPGLVAALRATGVAVVPASTPSIRPVTTMPVVTLPAQTPLAVHVSSGPAPPVTALAKPPLQKSRPASPVPAQLVKPSPPIAPQLPLLPLPSPKQFLRPPPLPPHPQTQPQMLARSPSPLRSLHSPALALTPSPSPSSSPTTSVGALAAAGTNQAAVAAATADLAVVEKRIRKKAEKLESKLRDLEGEIETEEKNYIAHTWAHGNVIRGWDEFLNRTERANKSSLPTPKDKSSSAAAQQKYRKARPSDHIFSLSSSSSKFRRDHPDIIIPKRSAGISKRKKKRGG